MLWGTNFVPRGAPAARNNFAARLISPTNKNPWDGPRKSKKHTIHHYPSLLSITIIHHYYPSLLSITIIHHYPSFTELSPTTDHIFVPGRRGRGAAGAAAGCAIPQMPW
jgi:hypothetical protein